MAKMTDYDAALKHRYRVEPGGEYVPGVTTVLGIIDKPGLKWGASKVAAEFCVANSRRKKSLATKHRATLLAARGTSQSALDKRALATNGTDDEVFVHLARGEFDRVWKAKADRGSRVHAHAEAWARGRTVDVLDDERGYVDALAEFFDLYRPHFEMVECLVLNAEHRYGGRFDAIMTINNAPGDSLNRVRVLGDWKTGDPWPFDVALQTVAYTHGQLASYDMDGTLVGLDALPSLDGCRVIYLQPNGTVKVVDPFEKVAEDQAWEAFIAARRLYEIHKRINDSIDEQKGNE